MPTDAYGVYSPSPLDAPDGAAQMQQMVSTFSRRLVHYVTDEADRDAQFGGSNGELVVATTQAPWKIWLRIGMSWLTIYSDTGWTNAGFTNAAGWDVQSPETRCRNLNGSIEVMVTASRTGGALDGGNNGNISDENICTIPPAFAPSTRARNAIGRYSTIALGYVTTSGGLTLTSLGPNAALSSGSGIVFNASYLEG